MLASLLKRRPALQIELELELRVEKEEAACRTEKRPLPPASLSKRQPALMRSPASLSKRQPALLMQVAAESPASLSKRQPALP